MISDRFLAKKIYINTNKQFPTELCHEKSSGGSLNMSVAAVKSNDGSFCEIKWNEPGEEKFLREYSGKYQKCNQPYILKFCSF